MTPKLAPPLSKFPQPRQWEDFEPRNTSAGRVARQLGRSDCVVRRCWGRGFKRCHLHEDHAQDALDRPVVEKTATSLLEEVVAVDDDNLCKAPIRVDKDILEFVQGSTNIIDADSDDENKMNNAAPVPTSSEMKNIMKRMPDYLDAHSNGEMNNKMNDIEQFDVKKYNTRSLKIKVSTDKIIEKGARNKDISVGVRNLVISHWKEGKSVRCIEKILKLSKSTVSNIIDRFRKTKSVENKQKSGRPRIFNEREERRIKKSVNPEIVRNVLRKHKYHGRVPHRKPYIGKANRQARLAFAKMYVKQPTE
ncbi:HTH_Tnp_Tc3_2 domain-containing protein [Trichonephila clavipes]|nr:HTH_Tnp_Tc3_2 domain-containing protein [Trichonephila clavipes]